MKSEQGRDDPFVQLNLDVASDICLAGLPFDLQHQPRQLGSQTPPRALLGPLEGPILGLCCRHRLWLPRASARLGLGEEVAKANGCSRAMGLMHKNLQSV